MDFETKISNNDFNENLTRYEKLKKEIKHINSLIKRKLIRVVIFTIIVFVIINAILFYKPDTEKAKDAEGAYFNNNPGNLKNNIIDSIYFTSTTISTTGYGDIVPLTPSTKVWTTFMQIVALYLSMRLFETAADLRYKNKKLNKFD